MPLKMITPDGDNAKIDKAIDSGCKMLLDIQYLLEVGPKRYESYSILITILKDIKRQVPREKAVRNHCGEACPPDIAESQECLDSSCKNCWHNFITKFLVEKKSQL